MRDGGEPHERIFRDDATRAFAHGIDRRAPPARNLVGTISVDDLGRVDDLGGGRSQITSSAETEREEARAEPVLGMARGTHEGGLAALERRLGSIRKLVG